jgi:uncharacterized membrane protein YhhN
MILKKWLMNLNRPSLILYFIACIFVVLFKVLEYDLYVLYLKSIIIPLVFIYYLITNEYQISWTKALVFLFCFIGDIFNLLNFDVSPLGALLSFLLVNLLLIKLSFQDFRRLKFNRRDRFPVFVSLLFIAVVSTSILSLKFEKMKVDLSLYIIYGIILSLLIFVSITNYIKKPNLTFLNLVVMCICFFVSDVFFMINKFYLSLYAFSFIHIFVQVFSYFFMVTYFIENDKYLQKQKHEDF